LQVDATQARLEDALSRPDSTTVELAVEETQPAVSAQDLATTRSQAEALLGSPLVLKFAEAQWQLNPTQLAGMATVNGTQGVSLDREQVKAWVTKLSGDVEQDPENARFSWQNGVVS